MCFILSAISYLLWPLNLVVKSATCTITSTVLFVRNLSNSHECFIRLNILLLIENHMLTVELNIYKRIMTNHEEWGFFSRLIWPFLLHLVYVWFSRLPFWPRKILLYCFSFLPHPFSWIFTTIIDMVLWCYHSRCLTIGIFSSVVNP